MASAIETARAESSLAAPPLFAGKTAIVTGGSRGIGKGIAALFLQHGAAVMVASRREASLIAAVEEMSGQTTHHAGIEYFVTRADDSEQAAACVHETRRRFGSVDILINNAGTNPFYGALTDIAASQIEKTTNVNLVAPLVWSQLVWHSWMKEHGGTIVNMASTGGILADRGMGWYNTTKAGLIHLTKQLALNMAPRVRVNAIAPGLIRTDMARALWEADEQALAKSMPLERLGLPRDIANAALFLSSELASWITGQTLVVDGGVTLRPPL
jgi:NAD(P)-dependent dehydrogenase (short-subunit alcohol dehydrogenase family)